MSFIVSMITYQSSLRVQSSVCWKKRNEHPSCVDRWIGEKEGRHNFVIPEPLGVDHPTRKHASKSASTCKFLTVGPTMCFPSHSKCKGTSPWNGRGSFARGKRGINTLFVRIYYTIQVGLFGVKKKRKKEVKETKVRCPALSSLSASHFLARSLTPADHLHI